MVDLLAGDVVGCPKLPYDRRQESIGNAKMCGGKNIAEPKVLLLKS